MTCIPGSGIFRMMAFSFSFLRCFLRFKSHPAFFLWEIPVKPVRQPLGKAVTMEGSLHSYHRPKMPSHYKMPSSAGDSHAPETSDRCTDM